MCACVCNYLDEEARAQVVSLNELSLTPHFNGCRVVGLYCGQRLDSMYSGSDIPSSLKAFIVSVGFIYWIYCKTAGL